ncbi:MAG: flagellar motor protein MotB [Lachnospiraceae bacterium]|nr:flagellar motor protein MotB [Lachnospiraceae bacterium]MDD7378833.1 flagellar motor protein MotB [Lachnospiraceae bacterium]MDY4618236.1 flagellar motor protein MotB [Lachnospiraceae bacterium]
MTKKKREEAPKGSPAWMTTFSDLMNLLLCFFVLLFSMSTVDAQKFEMIVASMQSSFSILPSGGSSVGEGQMVSAGVSQLELLDNYYKEDTNSDSETENENDTQNNQSQQSVEEAYQEQALAESEEMAEEIEEMAEAGGIQDQVEVDFNAQYVLLTLNGALLFDSGSSDIREDAYPLVDKIGAILNNYNQNIIEIEGHTDNVPISGGKYENNNVLSMYRALTVADYIREITSLNPGLIKSSGRGDYVPVADNSTPEGRARNRRVEIKIYNSYNSMEGE